MHNSFFFRTFAAIFVFYAHLGNLIHFHGARKNTHNTLNVNNLIHIKKMNTTKKSTYQSPITSVIQLESSSKLLAGSVQGQLHDYEKNIISNW